jgi:uncharacterized protein (DUF1501 family)
MLNRRQFLNRTLQTSSLIALGSIVPEFIAGTARAAAPGKDTILVVVELTGGNDGLNTVVPYADDLYHKARPTLRFTKENVLRLDDHVGLNPSMNGLHQLWGQGQIAVVQGVGYPNPDRSHFEAMDIWQSADPKRSIKSGWLGRAVGDLGDRAGNLPIVHVGPTRLPLALQGAPGGAISINNNHPFRLELGGGTVASHKARRRLLEGLSQSPAEDTDMLGFVQRRQLQTLTSVERLREVLESGALMPTPARGNAVFGNLSAKLSLMAGLIAKDFGTRIFYAALDGFDTHASQAATHNQLLGELAQSVQTFFQTLKTTGHDKRVVLMTFSEFGRRVQENGSKGTDHGAGSCLFVVGPAIQGKVVGKHPSLADLDSGDLRHQFDFRSVYATLLDTWLGCDSRIVLGAKWDHVEALKAKL